METSPEQAYTDLLRQLANPLGEEPEAIANSLREVERLHLMGQITDWQLQNAHEAYARTPGSKIAEAADWALDKAQEALHVGAEMVSDYTRRQVTTYTMRQPIRALLIAAGTGALLMGLVVMVASSGSRKVRRINQD